MTSFEKCDPLSASFIHLGLKLDVPQGWQNVSTLLLVGPPAKGPPDVVNVRVLPADRSTLDALKENSGAHLDNVEILHQADVSTALGDGKRMDTALEVSKEQLVRITLVVNCQGEDQERVLVVASATQSRAKYDDGNEHDVERFLETLRWQNT